MDQVISNKVYESIQPYTPHPTTTGTVLYANSYAGIPAVAMPEDLKKLLDSDVGLSGTNLLIQLQNKFRHFRNGPWYVDCRDGIIYIHNRKFFEEPVHTYVYQNENGEVLKIQFQTNYVQRSTKVILHESIDPDTKQIDTIQSVLEDPDKTDEYKKRQQSYSQVDNLFNSWWGSDGWESYAAHPSLDSHAWNQVQDIGGAHGSYGVTEGALRESKIERKRRELHTRVAEDPNYDRNRAIQEKRDSQSAAQLRERINTVINDPNFPASTRKQVQLVMGNFKDIDNAPELLSALSKITKGWTYTYDGDDQIEYVGQEVVDPKDYSSTDIVGTNDPNYNTWLQRKSGMENLNKDPRITVGKVDQNRGTIYQGRMEYPPGTFPEKATIIHSMKGSFSVPLYSLFTDLFSRYGGADRYVWAAHANANGGLKNKEKQIICTMTVVGRPLLESSMVINILNVGQRWSGAWYIKKCTHRMDAGSGYLCDLELTQNQYRSGVSNSKDSLSTQNVLHVWTDKNGKTQYGKKPPSSVSDLSEDDWTNEEIAWFNEAFPGVTKPESPMLLESEANVIQNQFAYKQALKEKYSDDPLTQARGTVEIPGGTISSTEGVTSTKPARYIPPEEYGISDSEIKSQKSELGDIRSWSDKFFDNVKKAKRNQGGK